MGEFPRRLLWMAGLAGAVIAGDQVSQVLAAVLRSGPGDPVWRFQFATLVIGRQVPLLFGLLLVAWTGWSAGASRAVRAMSWVSSALAVLLALAVTVLWVDGPAAREVLLADQLSVFTVHWIRALAVGATGIGCWALTGWGLGRASSNTTP